MIQIQQTALSVIHSNSNSLIFPLVVQAAREIVTVKRWLDVWEMKHSRPLQPRCPTGIARGLICPTSLLWLWLEE